MVATEISIDNDEAQPKKKSGKGILIGSILALVLGGGGFAATYSGMLGGGHDEHAKPKEQMSVSILPVVSFVELDPLVISLGTSSKSHHLRFRGSLEIVPGYEKDITNLLPRVVDVLNSYLRAVKIDALEDPAELIQLRAQMLRRIQLVTGEGRVRDLLILEFVVN